MERISPVWLNCPLVFRQWAVRFFNKLCENVDRDYGDGSLGCLKGGADRKKVERYWIL